MLKIEEEKIFKATVTQLQFRFTKDISYKNQLIIHFDFMYEEKIIYDYVVFESKDLKSFTRLFNRLGEYNFNNFFYTLIGKDIYVKYKKNEDGELEAYSISGITNNHFISSGIFYNEDE